MNIYENFLTKQKNSFSKQDQKKNDKNELAKTKSGLLLVDPI